MKKRILFMILCSAIIIGITSLYLYLNSVKNYKDTVASLTINDIDLSNISDGTYTGDCDVDFIYAKVEVTVKNGIITDINLVKHKNGKGKPAESIIDDILNQQSLEVDAVSGATNSSKVIKKAIENALTKGVK